MAFSQLLYRPPKSGRGHKLFLDPETSEISICDWSGATPAQSDDGPLVVGKLKSEVRVTASFSKLTGAVHFEVPVHVPRTGEKGRVWLDTATMRALAAHVEPVSDMSDAFRALIADMLFALAHCDLNRKADLTQRCESDVASPVHHQGRTQKHPQAS
jgi:hypothetical protein